MERTLSPEEKIRRAKEIYARRREGYSARSVATVNVGDKKNYGLLKRMILQMLICLVIYFIFYLIQNGNYIFSEDIINKTKEVLSYDINLSSVFSGIANWSNNINKEETLQNAIQENTITNVLEEDNTIATNAIGGAEPITNEIVIAEQVQQEVVKEVPQTDEEYIKTNFSFIKPVEGIVSSEFGQRNVNNPIVSKNHTGIDIAANKGTQIKAAMDGTVKVSSTVGDYGYHIKITNGDIDTLYAHCSKLYAKEGEVVAQGQVIAEVGSTGKSTGPHLHFEIIRGEKYINPRDILDF